MDFDRHKLEHLESAAQMQEQANAFGKTIRLARFAYVGDVLVLDSR